MNVMHLEGFQHGFLGEGLPWGAKRTSQQGEGALFGKGSFAKWKGHLDVEKQNSSREAFSQSEKDIHVGRSGIPQGKLLHEVEGTTQQAYGASPEEGLYWGVKGTF
jgi:hypothetical protein